MAAKGMLVEDRVALALTQEEGAQKPAFLENALLKALG